MMDFGDACDLGVLLLRGEDKKRVERPEPIKQSGTNVPQPVYEADWVICKAGFIDSIKAKPYPSG